MREALPRWAPQLMERQKWQRCLIAPTQVTEISLTAEPHNHIALSTGEGNQAFCASLLSKNNFIITWSPIFPSVPDSSCSSCLAGDRNP